MNDAIKIQFANYVLQKLANSSYWSTHTIDAIAEQSILLGLAEKDADGFYIERDQNNVEQTNGNAD